jgi:hypothetical protein
VRLTTWEETVLQQPGAPERVREIEEQLTDAFAVRTVVLCSCMQEQRTSVH